MDEPKDRCPTCGAVLDPAADRQQCPVCKELVDCVELIGQDEDYAWCL